VYKSTNVLTSSHGGCMPVYVWGWISYEGAKITHHIEEILDDLQYKHVFWACNGAIYKSALYQRIDTFTSGQLLCSWFLWGSKMVIMAGCCCTQWLTTTSACYEPDLNMWFEVEKNLAGSLAISPSKKQRCSLDPCVKCLGWSYLISTSYSISEFMPSWMRSMVEV
jgi:hypothetical protein